MELHYITKNNFLIFFMYKYLVFVILILIYLIFPKIKEFYYGFHRKKTLKKFEKICYKVKLNMNIEESMKISNNKIDHRYSVELHRKIPGSNEMHPVPVLEILDEIQNNFKADTQIVENIKQLSKEGNVDEFIYGFHPIFKYEKMYIGFGTTQNYGYVLEKKNKDYSKKTYVTNVIFDLRSIFPRDIAEKLHFLIPDQVLNPKHIYKYNDGKDKPMTCYARVKNQYKVEHIMEIFSKILEFFGNKKEIIEEANKYMEQFRGKNCNWIGLTNDGASYSATLYYDSVFST